MCHQFPLFFQNVQTQAFVLEHHDCVRRITQSTQTHEEPLHSVLKPPQRTIWSSTQYLISLTASCTQFIMCPNITCLCCCRFSPVCFREALCVPLHVRFRGELHHCSDLVMWNFHVLMRKHCVNGTCP